MIASGRKIGLVLMLASAVALICLLPVAAPATAEKKVSTISGTVVDSEGDTILQAEDGEYLLDAEGLDEYIGKSVEVTGVVSQDENGNRWIEVETIEIIQ